MMTRMLISGSLVLSGATLAAAQTAGQDRDDDRIQGEVQIRTDEARQAGDRQQDQTRQQTQFGQTGRDATGMQDRQNGQAMQAEDVLKELASADQLEIQLGELAEERAQDPQVQQFARQMVEHHRESLERVKHTAEQKDVDITEDELAEHHQAILDRLKEKQGEQFESAYMFHQAGKHVQDILTAQHVATTADDQQLQELARQSLPMLQQHLQEATDIAQNIATQGQAQPAGATFGGEQDQRFQQQDSQQPGQGLQQRDTMQQRQQQDLHQRDPLQPGQSNGLQQRNGAQQGQPGQGMGTGGQDAGAQTGGMQQDRDEPAMTPGTVDQDQGGNGAPAGQ